MQLYLYDFINQSAVHYNMGHHSFHLSITHVKNHFTIELRTDSGYCRFTSGT